MVLVCMFGDTKPIFNEESSGTSEAYRRPPPIGTSEHERLPSEDLTMTPTFVYTNSMIKQLKNHGLLDWDFVSTLSVISTLIILSEVIN